MSVRRTAFIDIGTNTILCLIAEVSGSGAFRVLDDLAEIARLGQGVDRTGWISAEGERASVEVLRRYLARCRELGVDELVAVGTSALRDARNSAEIRARLAATLGLQVRVLTGDEEAAYSYRAVQKGLSLPGQELLVIDVGGGSTELIRGNEAGVSQAASVDLGSVRLTERFLHADPPRADECERMVGVIDEQFRRLRDRWLQDGVALTLVGIAGTFTTLAAVEKRLMRYSHNEVHGCTLSLEEIRRQLRLFQSRSLAELKQIPGLEPRRADVILAGAYLVERAMVSFGSERVIVSDQGVRYGLLHERLDGLFYC